MVRSFRSLFAVSAACVSVAAWAKEVTLTVNSDAGIAAQLASEGKSLADGDKLVKEGAATLTMDDANGALLSGGTVKAGMLSVQPANGLGKAGADWTVEDGATIRIGVSGAYNSGIKFRLSGTGIDGAGALAVYNATYDASSGCDFYLNDDATMTVNNAANYSGLFTQGHLHFDGHALTLKGTTSAAAIRQRLGGQVYGSGTLVLDGVKYTSGGVTDANYAYEAGDRTIKLVNGASYCVNVQKQLDAYGTYDGASGTTIQTDSGTLASAAFQNLTGSPTLDASFLAVTVNGTLTVRGADIVAGACLDCRQAVTFDSGAAVDLADDGTIVAGHEYAVATATGGFVGQLPHVVGRAYRRQAVLRFSDDRKTLYAIFGDVPAEKDYGAVSAWYRFDELPVGTVLGHGSPIVNEADLSHGIGKIRLLDGTSESTTGIAPQTALPPEMTEIYDPLTGVTFTNRASLAFSTEAQGSTTSTKGAEILIAGDRSNRLPESSVTLEAFICSTGGVYNLMAPIVSLTGTGERTGESLALLVNANGFICSRYRTQGMDAASIWQHTRTTGDQLFDGRWHHVALVYDIEAGTVSMYVDYKLDNQITAGTSGLRYSENEASGTVYVGGYNEPDGRKFNGCIDEVRIVGAALSPETFLRRRCLSTVSGEGLVDDRTLLFVPMNGGTPEEAVLGNVNYSTNTPAASLSGAHYGSPAFDEDSPSKGVRGSHRRAASIATGSLDVGGASENSGAVVIQDGYYDYFADSFTIEGSFKTSGSLNNATILSLVSQGNYVLKLMVHDGCKFYLASNTPGWFGNTASTDPVNDGEWHRFRFFFDHEARTCNLYLDDVLTRTISAASITLPLPEARVVIGGQIVGGGAAVSQAFTGKIGPIRITRGKLKPHEWLGEVDPDEADPTMRDGVVFHLRGQTAEGLLDVQPYPSSRTPGEGQALSVSGAAAPTFAEDVRKPRYFLYGKEDGLVATNTGSIHLQNSALVFRGERALDCCPQTIELVARFQSIGPSAHLFRLAMTDGANAESCTSRVVCFVENGYLRFAFTKNDDGKQGDSYQNTTILVSELLGGWHHLAFSLDEDPQAGTTTLRTYLDRRLRDELVLPFTIWHSTDLKSHSLTIGRPSAATTEGLVGDIDEFRITEGVLTPDRFIDRVPSGLGLMMIVR